MDGQKTSKNRGNLILVAAGGLLIAVSLGLGVYQTKKLSDTKKSFELKTAAADKRIAALEAPAKYVQEQVEKDKLQAVFLGSGQVYFGNITHIDQSTITIEGIFYLKDGSYQKGGNVAGANASLVKLGKEMHGPEDVMHIERKNVEFWENLKSDGEVSKTINEYRKINS